MFFVQTLALVHGISHGLSVARLIPVAQAQGQPGQDPASFQDQTLTIAAPDSLAGHQDSFRCRLLDHLADHGVPLPSLLALVPEAQTPARNDFHEAPPGTRRITASQARGPPTIA